MMSLNLAKLTLLVAIGLCLFGTCACDGGINVKGRIYAQKGSEGNSQALIDQAQPSNGDLLPLKDVKVTLYHGGNFSPDDKARNSKLRNDSTLTALDGTFEVGGLTSPFRFNAGLVIEKDGYKPITKVFYHDKLNHEAIIILVPNVASDPDPK